jgi:hypothetical protein
MTGKTTSVRFKITNPGPKTLALVLEPWGEIYEMIPGEKYEVVGEGPDSDTLHVEPYPDHVIVWAWTGAIISLFRDGEQISPKMPQTVPGVPPGFSTRDFVRRLFYEDSEAPDAS